MEAQWSPQSWFNACYWSHRGGTREVEVSPRLRDWVLQQDAFIAWPQLSDHCASIMQPRQCPCIPSASFKWPARCDMAFIKPMHHNKPNIPSSATLVWLFWTHSKLDGDPGIHGDYWTSSVPPLNDQGSHAASFEPSTAAWPVLWSQEGGRVPSQ